MQLTSNWLRLSKIYIIVWGNPMRHYKARRSDIGAHDALWKAEDGMNAFKKTAAIVAATLLAAGCLTACSGNSSSLSITGSTSGSASGLAAASRASSSQSASSDDASSESSQSSDSADASSQSAASADTSSASSQATSSGDPLRDNIDAIIDEALATDFTSVAFSMKTETTATAVVEGKTQQQSIESSTTGEWDKNPANPRLHMGYSARSNTELGVVTYDMYFENGILLVTQGDQIYRDELGPEGLENYTKSIMAVTSKEEIDQLLDVASDYKVEQKDGDTVVSITADVEKLENSELYDSSSLPEGSRIATLVASYTIDADNHFKTVRIMSSTSGTPTYRVTQTYRYSDYDNVEMPAWPDLKSYIAQQTGIQTDANGNMYIVDDTGQVFYVSAINDDGSIVFSDTAQ